MRITKLLLICMCCLIVVPAVWGQAANNTTQHGILGYLDPRTGAFRPVPPAAEEGPDSAALPTFGGTINVTLTITVKSVGITKIVCTAGVSVIDAIQTSPRIYEESATATGTTKTCKLTIPYSWALATQSSDSMSTTYDVLGSGATVPPQRTSLLSPLDTRKVPANGTITNLTAAVTI